MASAVDICNLALGHLGDDATVSSIDPPEGSAQAEHCARFYAVARAAVIEMHPWRFATRRADLALSTVTPPGNWFYAYALPNPCLKPLAVLLPAGAYGPVDYLTNALLPPGMYGDNAPQDYVVETFDDGTGALYTNTTDAVLVYLTDVTDTTKFTPLCVLAIARYLASLLAGPIIKGTTGMEVAKAHMDIFEKMDFSKASASDANARQSDPYTTAMPAAIAARL